MTFLDLNIKMINYLVRIFKDYNYMNWETIDCRINFVASIAICSLVLIRSICKPFIYITLIRSGPNSGLVLLFATMNNLKSLFNLSSQLISHSAVPSLPFQFTQLRFRRVFPIIRGAPRPLPHYITRPESSKYNYIPIFPPDGKYTITPLKIRKLGGRDPETGRVVVKTLGGGNKKYYRWIDYHRAANPDGTPYEEKVFNIRYDPLRSTKLALVAGGMWLTIWLIS